MTKEEKELTITYLTKMQEEYIEGEGYERHPLPEYYALDVAIKALEQQPSDDCVSRQAVLAIAGDSCLDLDSYEDTKEFCDEIKELPPVTATRKSGLHWIERFNNEDKWLECPYCHKDSDNAYNYCPNCGASFKAEKRGNENE